MERSLRVPGLGRAVFMLLLLASALNAQTPIIRGTLSNFDVHNLTQWPAVDLELEGLPHWALLDYYKGHKSWGLHPRMHYLSREPNRPIVEIDWTDPFRPIPHCQTRHFGVNLDPSANPSRARAWWSVKVEQIPIPWQNWDTFEQGVIDIISLPPDAPAGVTISREFAVIPVPLELEQLVFDVDRVILPDGTEVGIQWMPVLGDPIALAPGSTVKLPIPTGGGGGGAVLVRYPVFLEAGDKPDLRFINEAVLEPTIAGTPPAIIGTLSNFDVHNFTSHPVEDMELHLMCIEPTDIVDIFPSPWGMPARINAIPGGTEVMWADPDKPWLPSKTFHFGVRLRPYLPGPRAVYGWFTRKVPIPVPWQTWRMSRPDVVVDVIRLAEGVPGPVEIQREVAQLPGSVPLDDLNWDLKAMWEPVDAAPIPLMPGGELELPIPVQGQGHEEWSVLVRYTVRPIQWPGGAVKQDGIVTRFVNAALLSLAAALQPQIVGSLSNFDVHNVTGGPVHDLELQLEGVWKRDVAGWYAGRGSWGIQPGEHRITDDYWEVVWKNPARPIPHCETRHFGVRLDPAWPPIAAAERPPDIYAWWSVKAVQIPLPWQWWDPIPGGVVDIIRPPLPPEVEPVPGQRLKEPFLLRRDYAIATEMVQLDLLNYDLDINWRPIDPEPFLVDSFFDIYYQIDAPPNSAVLLRYTVQPLGAMQPQIEVRVINEVVLGPYNAAQVPVITGTLSNFDVHNWLDQYAFGDLELDLWDIDPYEVLDWYRGGRAWGNPPRIDQIPRGTEVMWADPWDPVPYCKTPHFGVSLLPEAEPSRVFAYWSLKLPIPLPWQWWRAANGRVIDIVGLGPRYPGPAPVTINREYAVLAAPVPLENLNWDDLPGVLWQPDPLGAVNLGPGQLTELSIPVAVGDAAVVVRYTVADPTGMVVTRFVNEAEIEVPTVPPPRDIDCKLDGCDVLISWTNGADYDSVTITRDATAIANLPPPHPAGASESYRDPVSAAGPGWHTYCVIGVKGGSVSEPVCCRIEIPPVLPPEELQCSIEDCKVILTWKNGSFYDKKVVSMDGNPILVLPGPHPAGQIETVTLDIPVPVGPGPHVFCVVGEWCGIASEPRCCQLAVLPPRPPHSFECYIRDCKVYVEFNNGSDYDRKIIYRDGVEIATIPGPHASGDRELFIDPTPIGDLGVGTHEYCVVGVWCEIRTQEPACCTVEIKQPAPPVSIECSPEPDCKVKIHVVNGDPYAEKRVYDSKGNLILTVPGPHNTGDPEDLFVTVAAPGTYSFCVSGVWCGIESQRVCCDVIVTEDDCPAGKQFKRGDSNIDGSMNIADGVFILQNLFAQGPPLLCKDAADSNDDSGVNIGDAIYILQRLFAQGPPPPPPFPGCGVDTTPDNLDCVSYPKCP